MINWCEYFYHYMNPTPKCHKSFTDSLPTIYQNKIKVQGKKASLDRV